MQRILEHLRTPILAIVCRADLELCAPIMDIEFDLLEVPLGCIHFQCMHPFRHLLRLCFVVCMHTFSMHVCVVMNGWREGEGVGKRESARASEQASVRDAV
jgi:hypothetical protein